MRRFVLGLLATMAVYALAASSTAWASYCGAGRACCCRPTCCCQVTTVMKTVQETVFEEQEQTFFKTVYEDVVEMAKVPCVQYVEEIQHHCVPCEMMQPKAPSGCAPVKTCGPCGGESLAPVATSRKVPYTTFRAVCNEKPVAHPTVVAKQIPYTVTICVPKVITKQVPVQVCCPVPCCCKPCRTKCCKPAAPCGCGS